MKWKDKPALNKFAEVMMVLGIAAYFGLAVMERNGAAVSEPLHKFCFAVVWLGLGISYWNIKRKTAILYFVLAAAWFALAALYFLGILA
jgi:hypothetical protein